MKRKALSWLLLLIAAGMCHFCLRYSFGDFQGYVTVPICGTRYGLAHVKVATAWVSGSDLTYIPGAASVGALLSVVALGFAVWHAYRVNVRGRPHVV